MPPNSRPLLDCDIYQIDKWVEAGAKENWVFKHVLKIEFIFSNHSFKLRLSVRALVISIIFRTLLPKNRNSMVAYIVQIDTILLLNLNQVRPQSRLQLEGHYLQWRIQHLL